MKYKVISREQVSKRLYIESYYDKDSADSRRSELIKMYFDVVIVTEDECKLLSKESDDFGLKPNKHSFPKEYYGMFGDDNEAPYGQD